MKTFWWLIQYTYAAWTFFPDVQRLYPLVCIFVTFLASFVYVLLLGHLMYIWNYFHATYVYVPLVTYSVHLPPGIDVFYIYGTFIAYFLHTTPSVDLFSVSITSSWPSLYSRDVNSIFWLFTSHWWAYHYVIDFISLRTHTSGDLFYTNSLSWGFILYIKNYLMAYSVHTPPIFYNHKLFMS